MADWDNKEQVDGTEGQSINEAIEDEPIELTDIIIIEPDTDEANSHKNGEPVEMTEFVDKEDTDTASDIIEPDSEKEPEETGTEQEQEAFFDYKDKYLKMEVGSENEGDEGDQEGEEDKTYGKEDKEDKDVNYKKDGDYKRDITDLSHDQIEAALEKLIEKQYADTIQSVLRETVEKVIEKEISELRKDIQKKFENMGGVK